MAILRFISMTVIAFLLLSPLIKKINENIEKPVIIFAQDNSESIVFSKDSLFYRKEYPGKINAFLAALEKKYEVVTYSFSDRIEKSMQTGFTGKQTDLSSLFDDLHSRYSNRNVGAAIIATDGIYNKGANPFYAAAKITFPIYTIALGDTTLRKDIILKKISYNRNAFLGDKFPVELMIEADGCDNEKTEVTVKKKDEVVFRRSLTFTGGNSFQKISFVLDAREKGLNRYSVLISPVPGEINRENNRQEMYVEVTDERQKVLILSEAPHPDISAFREALESSSKFEVEQFTIGEFNQQPGKYDLVILYQLPSLSGFSHLDRFTGTGIPLLFILGTTTDYNAFNNLKTGMVITANQVSFTETQPWMNSDFSLFTIGSENEKLYNEFPPLLCPFGSYQFTAGNDILFYQKIGNVRSKLPLAVFFRTSSKKIGVIAGENIYKWRFSDFQQKENLDGFNELINKMVQYLSVKEDKSFLRITCPARIPENEAVELEGEVYNASYELINEPDLNLVIRDEQNRSYPFVFGKSGKTYYLNAGTFPVGNYTYQASVNVGTTLYQKTGEFMVTALNLESINTIADHNILYRVSKSHDADLVYPAGLDDLLKKINAREDIRPVSYLQKRYSDLVGNIWVFLLILALVSAEWFLRKRSGIY